jgi:hypothetical protein
MHAQKGNKKNLTGFLIVVDGGIRLQTAPQSNRLILRWTTAAGSSGRKGVASILVPAFVEYSHAAHKTGMKRRLKETRHD